MCTEPWRDRILRVASGTLLSLVVLLLAACGGGGGGGGGAVADDGGVGTPDPPADSAVSFLFQLPLGFRG